MLVLEKIIIKLPFKIRKPIYFLPSTSQSIVQWSPHWCATGLQYCCEALGLSLVRMKTVPLPVTSQISHTVCYPLTFCQCSL